jgi:hypothetical protein
MKGRIFFNIIKSASASGLELQEAKKQKKQLEEKS